MNICACYFSYCGKIPDKQLKDRKLLWVIDNVVDYGRESWWQKYEVAGCMVFRVSKQRGRDAVSFVSYPGSTPWDGDVHI